MDCSEFKKNISKYVLDRLEPDLREAFEEHYFECQECFQQLELKDALATIIRDEGVDGILGQAPDVDRADAFIEYAEAAERLRDYEEAANLYKKALELRPDDNHIFAKLKQIEQKAQGTDKEYILEVEPEDWLKNLHEAKKDRVKFGEFIDDFTNKSLRGLDLDGWDFSEFNIDDVKNIESDDGYVWNPGDENEFWFKVFESQPSDVPPPATMFLLGTGLAGLAGAERRKKRAKDKVTESVTVPARYTLAEPIKDELYKMPEEVNAVFILRTFNNISFEEIGKMLSLSMEAARLIYSKVWKQLFPILSDLSLNST